MGGLSMLLAQAFQSTPVIADERIREAISRCFQVSEFQSTPVIADERIGDAPETLGGMEMQFQSTPVIADERILSRRGNVGCI